MGKLLEQIGDGIKLLEEVIKRGDETELRCYVAYCADMLPENALRAIHARYADSIGEFDVCVMRVCLMKMAAHSAKDVLRLLATLICEIARDDFRRALRDN